jgi:hypothetical protein
MNYLLFCGAPSVGKTRAIRRLEMKYFIKKKAFKQKDFQDLSCFQYLSSDDFYACIEGNNNAGKKIRVLISTAADTPRIITGFKFFCDNHQPYDFIVSAIRDKGDDMYDCFYDTMIKPNVDYVLEIPMGKVTHRNPQKREIAVKWYCKRIDTLAYTILQHPPFSI